MPDTNTVIDLFRREQDNIVHAFEQLDGVGRFATSPWSRTGLGGGSARILEQGRVFERAGVAMSLIHGERVPASIVARRPELADRPFLATGISMIMHPQNPYVPSFHANFRYFEVGGDRIDWWFGGGADLTPAYPFDEDATHFHRVLKICCDRYDLGWYPTWKHNCDDYFYLRHRREMRGVGGIFFDHLTGSDDATWRRYVDFMADALHTLVPAYGPIVRKRSTMDFGDRQRSWQLLRRGRYVEFNLVYDKGTLFGLQTGGNIESIFMSMPPLARWSFDAQPEPDSPEAGLTRFLQPRDWVGNTAWEPAESAMVSDAPTLGGLR